MYKVLIADDEKRICSLIQALVQWEELGLEVVAVAYDGKEALEAIRKYRPDIAITDIRMPEFDGMKLIQTTQAEGISPLYIILSGYREFEYAHMAIKYGVQNYLLKPIQQDELSDALRTLKDKLDDKKKLDRDWEAVGNKLERTSDIIRNQLAQTLAHGGIPQADDYAGAHEGEASRFMAFRMVYHCDIEPENSKKIMAATGETIASEFEREGVPCGIYCADDLIWCLMIYEKNVRWRDVIKNVLDRAEEKMQVYGSLDVGVSSEHAAPERTMAEEALKALCWRWVYVMERVVYCEDLPEAGGSGLPQKVRAETMHAAELIDADMAEMIFTELADKQFGTTDPERLYKDLVSLWEELYVYLTNRFPEAEGMSKTAAEHVLFQSTDMRTAVMAVGKLISERLASISRAHEDSEDYYIRLSKKIIAEKLGEGLSLESVSSELHLSPVYLSALFKQKTGVNFRDYIITSRIGEAKRMMKHSPELSIARIGEIVGYPDQQYFSKVFTKVVGIKPSKYRKLYL